MCTDNAPAKYTTPDYLTDLDPVHGGLRGTCSGCPANEGVNEDGTIAQTIGCLPSIGDILRMKRQTGGNWACHENENKICAGLCHEAKQFGLDVTKGTLITEPVFTRPPPVSHF